MQLYLYHPPAQQHPTIVNWMAEVQNAIANDASWDGWQFFRQEYDTNCGLDVEACAATVLADPGPVLLVEPIRTPSLVGLRGLLQTRAIIHVVSVTCQEDLLAAFEDVRCRYNLGEPFLPRIRAAAILIVRKLEKLHMWAGRSKGYLWKGDLPKGRGIPPEFEDIVYEVANYLKNSEIIITKVSCGKTKYALNPKRREEIYRILNQRTFDNRDLQRILNRDRKTVSARVLDA